MFGDPTIARPPRRVQFGRSWTEGGAWPVATVTLAALMALPVVAVAVLAFAPTGEIWPHLSATVLPRYVGTSLLLVFGVAIGTFIFGVGTAWLVTAYRFPGSRILEWALILPLAVPAYITAYIYTDLLEFAGPVQSALRASFGWQAKSDYWFPEIRSTGGAALVMSLVLYPYVYLLSRAAFLEQSVGLLEAARILGRNPFQLFVGVALPLARPAIVIGLALVTMEVLNDFGTVSFFAVPTLTLGIFDVWLHMNSVGGAAQLALIALAFVGLLLVAERWARRQRRYQHPGRRLHAATPLPLGRARAGLAFAACLFPVAFGFLLPVGLLARDVVSQLVQGRIAASDFLAAAEHSLELSALAAALAVGAGLLLAYGRRLSPTPPVRFATLIASLGYAVPGAVLALGVMIPLGRLDNAFDGWMRAEFDISTGLILSGTVFAVTFGFTVRFLALAFGGIDAGLTKITPSMDDAARTLGHGPWSVLRRVHAPLLKSSLLTAALLVFVDGMKELPMTMMLRPFDFETLATLTHQYASDERFAEAAPAALMIVAAGILPAILLSRLIARRGAAGPPARAIP